LAYRKSADRGERERERERGRESNNNKRSIRREEGEKLLRVGFGKKQP
jgi:hypothetical protein